MSSTSKGSESEGSEEVECFLCYKKTTIEVEKKNIENELLNKELTIFFLVNKILKVSSTTCTRFFERNGNPSDWFHCCVSCNCMVRDAEIICKQLTELQKKQKSLLERIENFILRGHKKDALKYDQGQISKSEEVDNVSRSIRKEVALRKYGFQDANRLPENDEENLITVAIKPEPLDAEEEDFDSAYYPPSPDEDEQNGENDYNESNANDGKEDDDTKNEYKCGKCGKQYEFRVAFQTHVKKCTGTGHKLECGKCGQQYKYVMSFKSHIRKCAGNPKIRNDDDKEENHKCRKCGKLYKYLLSLKSHVKICTGVHDSENTEERISCIQNFSDMPFVHVKEENNDEPCLSLNRPKRKASIKNAKKDDNSDDNESGQYKSDEDEDLEATPFKNEEQSEQESSKVKNIEDHVRNVRRTKVKAKSKQLKCKCGRTLQTQANFRRHQRLCKLRPNAYMDVGSRPTNSGKMKRTESKTLGKPAISRDIKLYRVRSDCSAIFTIRKLCLCGRKPVCKHRRNEHIYRKQCQAEGIDYFEELKILIPESEYKAAEEVGYYACKLCRFGLRGTQAYYTHLAGYHLINRNRLSKCKVCKMIFLYKNDLDDHQNNPHTCKPFSTPKLNPEMKDSCSAAAPKAKREPDYISFDEAESNSSSDDGELPRDPDWNMEDYEPAQRKIEPKKKQFITSEECDPDYIYECKTCKIKYESENSLMRHCLYAHGEEIGCNEDDLLFDCDKCDKKYSTSGLLLAHKRTVHEAKKYPFACSVCHEEFKVYKNYIEHYADSHQKDGPVLCDICNVRFSDDYFRILHAREVHDGDNKPHRCSACNLGFGKDIELRYHRLKHFRKKTGKMCEFCSSIFASQRRLKCHQIKKHFEEMEVQPFKCDQCGKIFGDSYGLNSHIRTLHEKNFPYPCNQCSKGFLRENALAIHIQNRHVDGKKFLCSECPKQYWAAADLRGHEEIHKRQLLTCEKCGKKFKSELVLKKHVAKHSVTYPCPRCDKVFTKRWYAQVHLKGLHKLDLTDSLKAEIKRCPPNNIEMDAKIIEKKSTKLKESASTTKITNIQPKKNKEKRVLPENSQSQKYAMENTNSSVHLNSVPLPVPPVNTNVQQLYPQSSFASASIMPIDSRNCVHPYYNQQLLPDNSQSPSMPPQGFDLSAHQQPSYQSASSYVHQRQNLQLPPVPHHLFQHFFHPHQP